jgi:hypothetical protein
MKSPPTKPTLPEDDTQAIDLFLCHNRADKDWVRKLAEQVESETLERVAIECTLARDGACDEGVLQ